MCDCGCNECSFCTNQPVLWFNWATDAEETLSKWRPHTRNENDLRLGQYLFNHLCGYRIDIANKIRGSIVDPFNNDDLIPAFLEKVDELWTL